MDAPFNVYLYELGREKRSERMQDSGTPYLFLDGYLPLCSTEAEMEAEKPEVGCATDTHLYVYSSLASL